MRYMTLLERCYNRPVLPSLDSTRGRRGEGEALPSSDSTRGMETGWFLGRVPGSWVERCNERDTSQDRHDSQSDPIEAIASNTPLPESAGGPGVFTYLSFTSG